MNTSEMALLIKSVKMAISSVLLHAVKLVEYESKEYSGICTNELDFMCDECSGLVVMQSSIKIRGRKKEYITTIMKINTDSSDVMKVLETLETVILAIKWYYGANDAQMSEAVSSAVLSFTNKDSLSTS